MEHDRAPRRAWVSRAVKHGEDWVPKSRDKGRATGMASLARLPSGAGAFLAKGWVFASPSISLSLGVVQSCDLLLSSTLGHCPSLPGRDQL